MLTNSPVDIFFRSNLLEGMIISSVLRVLRPNALNALSNASYFEGNMAIMINALES